MFALVLAVQCPLVQQTVVGWQRFDKKIYILILHSVCVQLDRQQIAKSDVKITLDGR